MINEVMSKNQTVIPSADASFPDWIELYNSSESAVHTSGYFLSDKANDLSKWAIPDTLIPPYQFLLIYASGTGLSILPMEPHTNFSVNSSGEMLYLSPPDGSPTDSLFIPALLADFSYGRITDGGEAFTIFSHSSPGSSNAINLPAYTLDFSFAPGKYLYQHSLEITGAPELEIHITLNGEEPTKYSPLYTGPFLLDDRAGDPDYYCLFENTNPSYIPSSPVKKMNIIRVRAFIGDIPVSQIYTRSYLIGADTEKFNMPVISIVSDAENFFDYESGILINGIHLDSIGIPNYDMPGSEWERPVHVELFNEAGLLEWVQNCGLRVHGNGPQFQRQKSLRLIADNYYGSPRLNYPFFPWLEADKYNEIILRNILSAANGSMMSDELASICAAPVGISVQATRPVTLFINGEFAGIYAMKEKQDKYYVKRNFGADENNIDMLFINEGLVEEGDAADYHSLISFVENNDLSIPENYEYVSTRIDLENYTDYLIAEFYFGNIDWPYNNIKFWRTRADTAKWRWMLQDLDWGFLNAQSQNLTSYINNLGDQNVEWATFLGNHLLANDAFRTQFIARMDYLLHHSFHPETMAGPILNLSDLYVPQMTDYLDRYALSDFGITYATWNNTIASLLYFISHRPCALKEEIAVLYGIEMDIEPCTTLFPPPAENPQPSGSIFHYILPPINAASISAGTGGDTVDSSPRGEIITTINEVAQEQELGIAIDDNFVKVNCMNCDKAIIYAELLDLYGHRVYLSTLSLSSSSPITLPLPALLNGMYILRITNAESGYAVSRQMSIITH